MTSGKSLEDIGKPIVLENIKTLAHIETELDHQTPQVLHPLILAYFGESFEMKGIPPLASPFDTEESPNQTDSNNNTIHSSSNPDDDSKKKNDDIPSNENPLQLTD